MPTIATENRYFFEEDTIKRDPISGEKPPRLKFHAGGEWIESKTSKYMPCYNPSTGAVIAYAPQCTADGSRARDRRRREGLSRMVQYPGGKARASALQNEDLG